MAMVCFNCGKGKEIGRWHTHHPGVAGGRWKKRSPKTVKVFKPNLHWAKVAYQGNMKRVRLCTKCQRIYKEAMKLTSKAPQAVKTVQAQI